MVERLLQPAAAVTPSEPYVAYTSDMDEEEAPSTSCGTVETANRPDWMREMGPKFMDARVGEVVWPGTHDSGAYCEEFDFSKVVDHHWLRYIGTHLLQCLGRSTKQFASDWSRAQALSIRQQLQHGVRYVDLRVSKCLRDNEYYIVHSFCGPTLREVLNEIHDFLSRHPGECLLMEVVPISNVDHVELHNIFERKLGEFLLKQEPDAYQVSPVSLTISHLLAKGRIVLFYKLPTLYTPLESVRCFWDSRYIHAPWVLSLESTVKEGFHLEKFTDFSSRYHRPKNNRHKHLFHIIYVLTPTLTEILKSLDSSKYLVSPQRRTRFRGLQECAQSHNPRLGKFLERVNCHLQSEQCLDMGMIVSVDYVEESELMTRIIEMNSSRFKTTQLL